MGIKLKYIKFKKIIVFLILFILVIFDSVLFAQIYPTNIKLTILLENEIIGQEEIFEIIDLDDHILVPVVSLSRWINLDINYERNENLLTIYYKQSDRNVQIDLKNEIYFDHPEWSSEPPLIIEGDFYVTPRLIEYLTNSKLNWYPRKQELKIVYDYIKENKEEDTKIKSRPESTNIQPEISDNDFSIGSIHYKFGFDFDYKNEDENSIFFNNLTTVHGRANDWTYSIEHDLEYDYETDNYNIDYPFLNAKNLADDRLIILGDNRAQFPNTLKRVNMRGIYFQYPLQQISDRRAYTSVNGKANAGSNITLYVNERKIEKQYIYKNENSYNFENVPLKINRTNILRISIIDINGDQTEIVKKIAGSLNIFEEGTNQGNFAAGRYNKNNEITTFFNIGGVQIKYAPTAYTSLLWELGAEKNSDHENDLNTGNLLRVALRSKDLPLVFYVDWLTGSEINLIEHGVRASTLYTKKDGYINVSYSYVPPVVFNNIESVEGQQIQTIYEKELDENWLMNIKVQNTKSILSMDDLNLDTYKLAFEYSDKERNKFNIITELNNRYEEIEWNNLDLTEQSQNWFDIILEGKTYLGKSTIGGEVEFNLANINFIDNTNNTNITKRKDYTSIDFDFSRNLSENITLVANYETESTWIENYNFERESEINLKTRIKANDNTTLIAGISNGDKHEKDEQGNIKNEKLQELELSMNYNLSRFLKMNTGFKNTYLEEESYLTGEFSLDYSNPKALWGLEVAFEYIAPYGLRKTAQEEINIEVSRYLFSGLEGFLTFDRGYKSSNSEEPIYEASIYFSQAIGFANEKSKFQNYERGNHKPYIAGLVFLDENGNNKRDTDERLLDDITIFRNNSKTKTNNKGEFIFDNLRKGIHEIGFDSKEVPGKFKIVTFSKIVEIRENENLFLEFALTKLGEIKGQVIVQNNNKISLNHVGIKIEELNRTVFTNSNGFFNFKDIPLGNYTIKVLKPSIPEELIIIGENKYTVTVTNENLINSNTEIKLSSKNLPN